MPQLFAQFGRTKARSVFFPALAGLLLLVIEAPAAQTFGGCAVPCILLAQITPPASPSGDDVAILTGVSTPQSEGLDKEVETLFAQQAKLRAEMREQIRKRQSTTDLSQRISGLTRPIYQKSGEAADMRAQAAMEQRCVSPPPDSVPADPVASPYMCRAVLAVAASSGGNDPWTVCACARRYLVGVKKEIEDLRSRSDKYVGKRRPDSSGVVLTEPYTAAEVKGIFLFDQTIDVDHPFRDTFEALARRVQRELARDRVQGLLEDRPPTVKSESDYFGGDKFELARETSYTAVRSGLELLWRLYRTDAQMEVGLLQQAVNERFEREFEAALGEAKRIRANNDADEAEPLIIGMSRRVDQSQYPYVEETARALRAMSTRIRETRRRLLRDARAWTNFVAKDSSRDRAEFVRDIDANFIAQWSLSVFMDSWRENFAMKQYANNREWMHLFAGQAAGENLEGISRAFQQRLPEASVRPKGTLVLEQPVNQEQDRPVAKRSAGIAQGGRYPQEGP